jgi:DNA invertase Pin-like site-specific DNA recombinase
MMTMIEDDIDADESDRAEYVRRPLAARAPELTEDDIAALAEPPVDLLMAEIGEKIIAVIAALAEKERRLISQRTKDALAVRKAQGVKLGGPQRQGRPEP